MKCRHCNKTVSQGRYCSDQCEIKALNLPTHTEIWREAARVRRMSPAERVASGLPMGTEFHRLAAVRQYFVMRQQNHVSFEQL